VTEAELAEYEACKSRAREYLAGLPEPGDEDYDMDLIPF
jgi:hypothetical protein